MTFDIKITNINKAKNLIGQDWPTHIISVINDAGGTFPATHMDVQHNNHIVVNFHDVENLDTAAIHGFIPPTFSVIKDIFEETSTWDLKDAKVLVHCSAGKSRSTAIALGLLVQQGYSIEDAFAKVKTLSPAMCPNRLIIEYVDSILNLQGELIEIVRQYYEQRLLIIPGLGLPNRGGYNC